MATKHLIHAQQIRRFVRVPLATIAVVAVTACQSGAPAPTASPTAPAGEPTSSPAASSSAASSALAGSCLDSTVVAALDEIEQGNFDTDPSPTEVADALEALTLEGAAADARDSLVTQLRTEPIDAALVAGALSAIKANVALPEC